MVSYLIIGNLAHTAPFHLNGLPNAGRMDILCRCVGQSLFISHGIRTDVDVYLYLKGEPDPSKMIWISGGQVRYMGPDERNIGGIIRKALGIELDKGFRGYWEESTPGVKVSRVNLEGFLGGIENPVYLLREDGADIRTFGELHKDALYVLGDHQGLETYDEAIVLHRAKGSISVSPVSLQADQCITLINNEYDRNSEDTH